MRLDLLELRHRVAAESVTSFLREKEVTRGSKLLTCWGDFEHIAVVAEQQLQNVRVGVGGEVQILPQLVDDKVGLRLGAVASLLILLDTLHAEVVVRRRYHDATYIEIRCRRVGAVGVAACAD